MKKLTLLILLVLLMTACVPGGLTGPANGGAQGDAAVTIGDTAVSQNEFRYYFYSTVYDFMNNYGWMMGDDYNLDLSLPLDEQIFYGETTWFDYFNEQTVQMIWNTTFMYEEAVGMGLTQDADSGSRIDEYIGQFSESGDTDISETLKQLYGGTLDESQLREIVARQLLVSKLYELKTEELTPTLEEAERYCLDNPDEFAQNISVRHILIASEDSDAASARAEAGRIHELWLAGAADEDYFAELAAEYTDDPGSAGSGGLYENVAQGDMVEEFDAWCFDPERGYGDSGLVDTTYGTHIMFFVDRYQNWDSVQEALFEKRFSEYIADGQERYPMQIGTIDISLES